ncbi:hypothetical protein BC03BB108_D0066 (plasmid) [Bacillus cereus 03BB108]|nr:hypothetical protein BC03BB108_D0066 [Bacillus cereus 03BB108]
MVNPPIVIYYLPYQIFAAKQYPYLYYTNIKEKGGNTEQFIFL